MGLQRLKRATIPNTLRAGRRDLTAHRKLCLKVGQELSTILVDNLLVK